jgi:hypothetical protein
MLRHQRDSRCETALTTLNCMSDPLPSFPYPNLTKSGTLFDENALPPNGTESFTNLPGDAKTATSGSTLAWTLVSDVSPLTAITALYQAPAASTSVGGVAASSVAGSSAGGTSSTAGAPAASTSKSADMLRVERHEVNSAVKVGMVVWEVLLCFDSVEE